MVFQQFSHMKSTASVAPRAPRGFASNLSWAAVPNSAGEVVKGVQELEGPQGPTRAPRSLASWNGMENTSFFDVFWRKWIETYHANTFFLEKDVQKLKILEDFW